MVSNGFGMNHSLSAAAGEMAKQRFGGRAPSRVASIALPRLDQERWGVREARSLATPGPWRRPGSLEMAAMSISER
jgi:hypothetical protein